MSMELVMWSNHLILSCPLLNLPSIFPSIWVFSSEYTLHIMWSKNSTLNFIISLFNEYSGSISFRIDWFDLLAVQGTLKSLSWHHNSKASIPWHWAFFMVQFSHLYMTTGKTIALSIQTFVGKVMSLLFSMLFRFVYGFPGGASGQELACQCRRPTRQRFSPWVGNIPWRKAWQPTLVFLPGESHG